MKRYMLLAVLVLSAGLSGCKEKGSDAKKAIQQSLNLLNESRIQEFRASLIGEAQKQMRSDRAVETLKSKVADLGQLELGNESVVNSSSVGQNTSVVNRVEVKRGRDVVGTVDVQCDTTYSSRDEVVCEEYREPTPRDDDRDDSWSPNPPRYDGRNDNDSGSSSGPDRDRDSGHIVPGPSNPKPDPDENRNPDRPPRYPGSATASLENFAAQFSAQSIHQLNDGFSYQTQSRRTCRTVTRTSSQTTCRVSQINL